MTEAADQAPEESEDPHRPFAEMSKFIAGLSDEHFSRLLRAFDAVVPGDSQRQRVSTVMQESKVRREDARAFVRGINAVAAASIDVAPLEDGESPAMALARSIVDRDLADEPQDARETVANRMVAFLETPRLRFGAKASFLQWRHERVLRRVEVLSDLRPVFGGSDNEDPLAFMIWHTLRVTFDSGPAGAGSSPPAPIEFAMDGHDLELIQREVARAITKHRALRTKLADLSAVHYPVGDLEEEKHD